MLRLASIAGGGVIAVPWTSVSAVRESPAFNAADADEVACRRHLRLIFEALQRYVADCRSYPQILSDLADTGYLDARVLLCPAVMRRGDFSLQDPGLMNWIDRERYTLYKYEYALGTEKHSRLNWQRQTEAGDWVTIIRCNEHRPKEAQFHLNLALNGAIYPSRLFWEQELIHLCAYYYLKDAEILKKGPLPLHRRMGSRAPEADASRSADLTLHYNALLSDGWMTSKPVDSLAEFDKKFLPPSRLLNHEEVAFDVRGALVLDGGKIAESAMRPRFRNSKLALFPTVARPIVATLQGSRLHALIGCFYEAEPNAVVGRLTVRYGNHRQKDLFLRYGENIAATREELTRAGHRTASPVWSPTPHRDHSVHTARLVCHVVWEGLDASQVIREIQFAGTETNTCLFLLALSTSG